LDAIFKSLATMNIKQIDLNKLED